MTASPSIYLGLPWGWSLPSTVQFVPFRPSLCCWTLTRANLFNKHRPSSTTFSSLIVNRIEFLCTWHIGGLVSPLDSFGGGSFATISNVSLHTFCASRHTDTHIHPSMLICCVAINWADLAKFVASRSGRSFSILCSDVEWSRTGPSMFVRISFWLTSTSSSSPSPLPLYWFLTVSYKHTHTHNQIQMFDIIDIE